MVLISTIGKVLTRERAPRELPPGTPRSGRGDLEGVRETIDNLSVRLERLEEERDFYRDLLESPKRPREIPSPDVADESPETAGPP